MLNNNNKEKTEVPIRIETERRKRKEKTMTEMERIKLRHGFREYSALPPCLADDPISPTRRSLVARTRSTTYIRYDIPLDYRGRIIRSRL